MKKNRLAIGSGAYTGERQYSPLLFQSTKKGIKFKKNIRKNERKKRESEREIKNSDFFKVFESYKRIL